MTRRIAVTGATGFLGQHLMTALADEDAGVRVLARRELPPDLWPDAETVAGDLDRAAALEWLVAGCDAVVHGAGLTAAPDRNAFFRVNRDGTERIARIARDAAPDARFVLVSSLAARAPWLSDYAASKRAGEDAARAIYADAPDKLVIVRPPAIYGPGDLGTLAIFRAAQHPIVPVFGDGHIALVHVTDAAASLARLAMGDGTAGLYALADPNPGGYRMIDILGEAAGALQNRPRFVRLPGMVLKAAGHLSGWWGRLHGRAPIFNAGKAREMLHPDWSVAPQELLPLPVYRARIGIRQGFHDTVAWYLAEGWFA